LHCNAIGLPEVTDPPESASAVRLLLTVLPVWVIVPELLPYMFSVLLLNAMVPVFVPYTLAVLPLTLRVPLLVPAQTVAMPLVTWISPWLLVSARSKDRDESAVMVPWLT